MIFLGPPGCGKTTSILCLARTMLGESFSQAVLELNASNDRGIEVVRNRIKMFAQKKCTLPPGKHKIIILDEADSMTEGAQQVFFKLFQFLICVFQWQFRINQPITDESFLWGRLFLGPFSEIKIFDFSHQDWILLEKDLKVFFFNGQIIWHTSKLADNFKQNGLTVKRLSAG